MFVRIIVIVQKVGVLTFHFLGIRLETLEFLFTRVEKNVEDRFVRVDILHIFLLVQSEVQLQDRLVDFIGQ